MHELALACELVELAEDAARAAQAERVTAVHLRLGTLSGVVAEALQIGFASAIVGTLLDGAQLTIEATPVVAWCSACGCERTLHDIQWLACPVCAQPLGALRSGREIEIAALEIVTAETAAGENAPASDLPATGVGAAHVPERQLS